ncbi:MAG: winged helix-turn-helix domain-containing protein, partial [Holophagales bacterium]|nr:winged helix-turn-helix domain-containing protein [Holophagales bacterium]
MTDPAPTPEPTGSAGTPDPSRAFRLGPWRVDPMLLRLEADDGRRKPVGKKVMEALLCLAARPGEAVTKDELVAAVWDGAFTTDEALTTLVYELRKALGDDARRPRFVGTIRGRGYRLLIEPELSPPLNRRPAGSPGTPAVPSPQSRTARAAAEARHDRPIETPSERGGRLPKVALIAISGLAVAAAILWSRGDVEPPLDARPPAIERVADPTAALSPRDAEPGRAEGASEAPGSGAPISASDAEPRVTPEADRTRSRIRDPARQAPSTAPEARRSGALAVDPDPASVAVMPLASPDAPDDGADSSSAFASGLSERLVVELGRLGGLHIIPGFSSVAVGRSSELGTDAVVEGSVRQMGGRLAISVQLVERSTGRLLWGAAYERRADDVLELQRQLSYEIAHQVRAHLASPARSVSPEAEEAYRLGDYFLQLGTTEGHAKARDYFSLA